MSDELLNCPFCGSSKISINKYIRDNEYNNFLSGTFHKVKCDDCHSSSLSCFFEKEAVAAWNKRASQWVKCKDKLPKEGQFILVEYELDPIPLSAKIKFGNEQHKYHFEDYFRGRIIEKQYVKHWMPMPELPQPPEGE